MLQLIYKGAEVLLEDEAGKVAATMTGGVIGNRIDYAVCRVFGKSKSYFDSLRTHDPALNHDIERSTRKAYLEATLELVLEARRRVEGSTDRRVLRALEGAIRKDLNNVEDTLPKPLVDARLFLVDSGIAPPERVARLTETLEVNFKADMSRWMANLELSTLDIVASVAGKIKSRKQEKLHYAAVIEELLGSGWTVDTKSQRNIKRDWYNLIAIAFMEELKSNQRLANVFQTKLLAEMAVEEPRAAPIASFDNFASHFAQIAEPLGRIESKIHLVGKDVKEIKQEVLRQAADLAVLRDYAEKQEKHQLKTLQEQEQKLARKDKEHAETKAMLEKVMEERTALVEQIEQRNDAFAAEVLEIQQRVLALGNRRFSSPPCLRRSSQLWVRRFRWQLAGVALVLAAGGYLGTRVAPPKPGVVRIVITDLDCPDPSAFRMFRRQTGSTEDLRFTNRVKKELDHLVDEGAKNVEVVRLKKRMMSHENPSKARALLQSERGHVLIWGDISTCGAVADEAIHVDWKFDDVPGSHRYSERRIKIVENSSIALPKFNPKETTALVAEIVRLSQRGVIAPRPDGDRDIRNANVQGGGMQIAGSGSNDANVRALKAFNDGVALFHQQEYLRAVERFRDAAKIRGRMNNWALALYYYGSRLGLPKGEGPWRDAFGKFADAVDEEKNSPQPDEPLIAGILNNWGIALDELARLLADEGKLKAADEGKLKAAEGLWEDAFRKYDEALAYKVPSFEANHNWGLAEFEWGKQTPWPKAESILRNAKDKLELAAKSTDDLVDSGTALSNSVAVLLELADHDSPRKTDYLVDARERGEEALKRGGNLAAYNLACVALRNGGKETARKYLMMAVEKRDLPKRDIIDGDKDMNSVRSESWFAKVRESAER